MPSEQSVLKRLRTICRRLPEVIETTTFGHPTFQAGKKKTFVVLDDHERDGALCIVFKAALADQQELLRDPRFFPSKFGARHGWTALEVDGALDGAELTRLVTQSYRLLANRRMLAALDGPPSASPARRAGAGRGARPASVTPATRKRRPR